VERDYQLARNKAAEITREIAATEAEKANFAKTWRQESLTKLSETWQQRDEVVEQLHKARLRASLVALLAPEDGVVLEVGKRSIGSVLKEAEPLFTLVPLNAPLEVEAEISPQDIGELRVGDPVRIKLDAYPFQKHGTVQGRVSSISADAFTRQGPTGAPSYYYLVRARLEDTHLEKLPQPTRLLPGMTLQAEVQTGKRSVLAYFLYPVLRVLDESFRER
jgi:HlyD family secretion protein